MRATSADVLVLINRPRLGDATLDGIDLLASAEPVISQIRVALPDGEVRGRRGWRNRRHPRGSLRDRHGEPVGFADTPYETRYPQPGWAEQDPNDWWVGMGSSVRKVLADAGVAAADVAGICCDTTCCTVVALDDAGDPLMPCILWMDMRAAEQTEQVLATGDVALRVNSDGAGPVSAEWMVPKALWLKQNRPELFARAAKVCEYQDYVNLKLTGRYCASANNVAVRDGTSSTANPRRPAREARHAGARGEVAEGRRADGPRGGTAVGGGRGAPGPRRRHPGGAGRRRRLRRDGRPRDRSTRSTRAHHRLLSPPPRGDRGRVPRPGDMGHVLRRAGRGTQPRGRGRTDVDGLGGELVQDDVRRARGFLRRGQRRRGADPARVRGPRDAGAPAGE